MTISKGDNENRAAIYHQALPINLDQDNNSWAFMSSYLEHHNAQVLDVGCACGDLGRAIKGRFPELSLIGIDLNPKSCQIASETGAYSEVRTLNLDELSYDKCGEWIGFFDYIMCGDVLEHLHSPVSALKGLKRFLMGDGLFVASIPNVAHMAIKAQLLTNHFDYEQTGLLDQTHVHFFTGYSIASTFAEAGLAIVDCKYTMFPRNAYLTFDPWDKVSRKVMRDIFLDWESYVAQYVVAARRSDGTGHARLLQANLERIKIEEECAPPYIKAYRGECLKSLEKSDAENDELLNAMLKKMQSALIQAEKKFAEQEEVLLRTQAELNRVHNEVDNILKSRFWRLTRPLRKLLSIYNGRHI